MVLSTAIPAGTRATNTPDRIRTNTGKLSPVFPLKMDWTIYLRDAKLFQDWGFDYLK